MSSSVISAEFTDSSSSGDIGSSVFHSLPDMKPDDFNEMEYCLFEFMDDIADSGSSNPFFGHISFIILLIQWFAALNVTAFSYYETISNKVIGPIAQILFFSLNLNPYNNGKLPSPTFFYFLDIVAIFVVFSFFLGIIAKHTRKRLNKYVKVLISIMVFNVNTAIMMIITNYGCYFLFQDLLTDNHHHIFQSIILVPCAIFMNIIYILLSRTTFQSINFFNAELMNLLPYINENVVFEYIIMSKNYSVFMLEKEKHQLFLSLMTMFLGIMLYFYVDRSFYLSTKVKSISLGYAFTSIVSSVLGLFQISGKHIKPDEVMFFLFWVLVGYVVVKMWIENKNQKYYVSILSIENFDSIGIENDLQYLEIAKAGFSEGCPNVVDGSLFTWGLQRMRSTNYNSIVLMLSDLLPVSPAYLPKILNQMKSNTNPHLVERFTIYQHEKIMNRMNTGALPPIIVSRLSDIESKIFDFNHFTQLFIEKICSSLSTNFVYLEVFSSMKSLLKNYLKTLIKEYPNNIEVIKLYANYKNYVEHNEYSMKKWKSLSEEIAKAPKIFSQFSHIKTLNMFPKMQQLLMDKVLIANSNIQRKSIACARINTQDLLFPAYMKKEESVPDQSVTHHLFLMKTMITQFIPFLVILISLFIGFRYSWRCYSTLNNIENELISLTDLIYSFSTLSNCFSVFLSRTVMLLSSNSTKFDNINEVKSLHKSFQALSRVFFDTYKINSYTSTHFKEIFSWTQDNDYKLPSFNNGNQTHDELATVLNVYSTLFLNIFPANPVSNSLSTAGLIFLSLSYHGGSYIRKASNYMDESVKTYVGEYIPLIVSNLKCEYKFSLIICIIFCLIPILFAKQFTNMCKYFSNQSCPPTDNQQEIVKNRLFITHDISSLASIIVQYYLLVLLVCFMYFFSLRVLEKNITRHGDQIYIENSNLIHDSRQLSYISSSLVDLCLLNVDNQLLDVTKDILNKDYSDCTDFFIHGGQNQINFVYSRLTTSFYKYTKLLLLMKANDSINYNATILSELKNMSREILIPHLENQSTNTYKMIGDQILGEKYRAVCDSVILFSVSVSIFLLFHRYFRIFRESLLTMFELVQFASSQALSHTDPDSILYTHEDQHIHKHNQLQIAEINRLSLIDLFDKPCAIIDKDNIITQVNRHWYPFWNLTPDKVIGIPATQITGSRKTKVFTRRLDEDYSLLIINELRVNEMLKTKLKKLQRKSTKLRSSMIPSRFLQMKEGKVQIPYIISCSIIMVPIENDDVSPDEWIMDVRNLELWIKERCQLCDDVDILRSSVRELTLLFGCNEKYNPQRLVTHAFTILLDIMRFSIEMTWKTGGIDLLITVSSSANATFVFSPEKATRVEMFGDVFDKQMILRDFIDFNTIICDDETMELLKSLNLGIVGTEIAEGIFLFDFEAFREENEM